VITHSRAKCADRLLGDNVAVSPYPHLLTPVTIGPVEVRNRVYLTAHHPGLSAPDPSAPGFFGPAPGTREYYLQRADGGIGLIIQGGTIVSRDSEYTGLWQMFSERAVDDWAPIVEAVHATGATMFCQLLHAGHHADKFGVYGGPKSSSSVPPVEGAVMGGVYFPLSVPVRAMTKDDIRATVDAFGTSARNAAAAGYRGIEVHASHSYLVEQFYSPFFNKRDDEYGGSLDNRLRFFWEVLAAIRDSTGGALALGARLICDELLVGGLGIEEMGEIAQRLDESGLVDFLDLDMGTYHSFDVMIAPWQLPDHWEMEHVTQVAALVRNVPRLGCPGRFHDPALGEALVSAGTLDLVGGTRGFFADPAIARKAAEGRASDIRPCIGLASCMGRGACVVNPSYAHPDWASSPLPAAVRRRVLVAGGGPAGLEAARVAADRGHHVTLYDAADALGGALRLMAAIPDREHVVTATEWWGRQLDRLGVEVVLGTSVTPAIVGETGADAVVVATGAEFDRTGATAFASDPIPGWDRPNVFTPDDVLTGRVDVGGRVIVLDEETTSSGHGVAEVLAERGASVQLVTRQLAVGAALTGGWQQSHVMRRLERFGITPTPNTHVREIGACTVTLFDVHTGRHWTVDDVDAVVLVTGRSSRNRLAEELARSAPDVELHLIGDARYPRDMATATAEGHEVGRELL
jgi:dimethylamine/trimethylamine dehydrogenase